MLYYNSGNHEEGFLSEGKFLKRRGDCIYAKLKGARGKNTLDVCINTEYQFRDKAGKPCELE